MSRQRNYTDYLHDMVEYANDAEQFVAGMTYEQFLADRKTQLAVIRALEVIGEAATHIPAEVQNALTAVPWRDIKGMRNQLIHAYPGIDLHVVWDTVLHNLPPLKAQIAAILTQMDER
jgi:uncharacterized protein with HEPN domain